MVKRKKDKTANNDLQNITQKTKDRVTDCIITYRLIHAHFHIGLVIIPRPPYWPETQSRANMGRGMITRPIWKCPYIKLFITYFRHLEKRHPYWPGPIWASIWKWFCSNPITGYFPGVWKYGQFISGHIGHTKMPLFELSM
jgi:hypothetical protein